MQRRVSDTSRQEDCAQASPRERRETCCASVQGRQTQCIVVSSYWTYMCAAAALEILAAGGGVPDPFGGGPIGDVRRTGV